MHEELHAARRLFGSYEALKSGSSSEAMVDFTGGLTELIDLGPKQPADLFTIMIKAVERCALMGCSIEVRSLFLPQPPRLLHSLPPPRLLHSLSKLLRSIINTRYSIEQ